MGLNIKIDKKIKTAFLIGAAVTFAAGILYLSGAMEMLEYKSQDFFFNLRGERTVSSKVKVICMGDESINDKAMGRWPWRRRYHAILLNILSKYKPAMVMYDVLFTEKSDYAEDDQILAEQLPKAKIYFPMFSIVDKGLPKKISDPFHKLLLARIAVPGKVDKTFYNAVELVLPVSRFTTGLAGSGYANAIPDSDGTTRRVALLIQYDGRIYPHIAFIMAMHYLGADMKDISIKPGKYIKIKKSKIGSFRIPVDEKNQMLLNYPGGIRMYHPLSFLEVIDNYRTNPSAQILKDAESKAIFVGLTATGTVDLRPTPFSSLFPMVGVVAATFANIVDGNYMKEAPRFMNFLMVLFVGFFVTVFSIRFRPLKGAVFAAGVILLWCVFAYAVFLGRFVISVISPVAAGLFSFLGVTIFRYAGEEKEKKFIKNTFQRYVSPQIVEELISNPQLLKMGGQKAHLSVFFSDVRGFTSMSEKMEPEEVVKLLNEYLTEMTKVIFKYNGTLDKFIGDAIMAIWGAPKYFENHAELAVRAAVEMQEEVGRLCEKWAAEGRQKIGIGMGINTGFVVVGNMGSASYADYTVIGDNVNLAARLEENALAENILITEATYDEVKNIVKVEKLEPLTVKGKAKPVQVYRVLQIL